MCQEKLYKSCDTLLDNGIRGQPMRTKRGRFRETLLGKRVDYSGFCDCRSPSLSLHRCGLPREIAIELSRHLQHFASNIGVAKSKIREKEPLYGNTSGSYASHPVLLNRRLLCID
ncbi:hypothetical protein DVH24_001611 [Malus domestica]|uniref:Uncharacterized protein n=1 Tax=Malus domestica TaxID=3750 RepID=A0A498KP18_MALDO|nr:hypothetical protein DVH24_001611 [Malus domestica]